MCWGPHPLKAQSGGGGHVASTDDPKILETYPLRWKTERADVCVLREKYKE